MKNCPYCDEQIQDDAKKCRHCGEWLNQGIKDTNERVVNLRTGEGKSKSRAKIWIAIMGVAVLVFVIIGIGSQLSNSNNSGNGKPADSAPDAKSNVSQSAKKPEEQKYKMNDKVPVGHFLFSVGSVKDLEEISDGFTKKKAAGIYKLVGIAAINTNKESRYLDNSMFKLLDSKGRIYDNSTEGSMAVSIKSNGEMDLFLKQISPSLGAGGVLVFDVPEDAEGFMLEVSGGFGSPEKRYIELQ
ncbi:MAG: DUF4352 domain-containing protein [Parcubacteria group bacterium]|jgi:hypothetical protein